MQKKNILHITNSNALSLYLISIAKLYDKDKYNLIIGCFDAPGPLNDELTKLNISNFNIPVTSNYQYLFRFLKLYRLLKKNKIDILHLHTFYPSLFGVLAGKLAKTKKIIVTRHHADYHILKNKKIHSFFDAWAANHCTSVIAVSEWTKKVMVEQEHVKETKIRVILNGIIPLALKETKNKDWIRKEFNISSDSLVFTCVSRLFPEKNLELVLQLVSLIKKENKNITLLICGDGLNGAYHKKLIGLCKTENIQENVLFLGFRNDVGDILKNSDAFLHPSLGESFGFAVLEAMSLGVPIFASNIPSVHEIAGKDIAYIFDPHSIADLYEKYKQWVNDPAAAKERIRKGIERYNDQFTFKKMISKYEEVYGF